MAETTNISWADSTLNIWMGCTKVSTGAKGACEHCYAEVQTPVRALGIKWGNDAQRRETKGWRAQLRKISRMALAADRPWFVFVNSLSDFWDNKASASLRAEALEAFRQHPHLTFLLLTKRPQNIVKMAQAMAERDLGPYATEEGLRSWWPRNVALMCTVVTQLEADRDLPWLLKAQATLRPAFAGVSMEPLMEHVDIAWALSHRLDVAAGMLRRGHFDPGLEKPMRIGWVITGGETDQGGKNARPSHPDWFRGLRDQCAAAGLPTTTSKMASGGRSTIRTVDRPRSIASVRRPPAASWMALRMTPGR